MNDSGSTDSAVRKEEGPKNGEEGVGPCNAPINHEVEIHTRRTIGRDWGGVQSLNGGPGTQKVEDYESAKVPMTVNSQAESTAEDPGAYSRGNQDTSA